VVAYESRVCLGGGVIAWPIRRRACRHDSVGYDDGSAFHPCTGCRSKGLGLRARAVVAISATASPGARRDGWLSENFTHDPRKSG